MDKATVIKLYWLNLRRESSEGLRSTCPFCKDGVLPMRRNDKLDLWKHDNCIGCGIGVEYLDDVIMGNKLAD